MLFKTVTALLAAASVASAAAIGYSPAPAVGGALNKRAMQKRATCGITSAQRAEARRLSSLSRKLKSQQKSLSSKKSVVYAKSSKVNSVSASSSLEQGAAFTGVQSVASSQSDAAAAIASAASSISSAFAAATSAAASSNCYSLSSVDVTLIASATDPSSCATACGANYDVIALSEPSSPPATCFCLNAGSLADLGTPVASSSCDAAYGSTDGSFVSAFAV